MAKSQSLAIPFHVPQSRPVHAQSDLGNKIIQLLDQKGNFRDVAEQEVENAESTEDEVVEGQGDVVTVVIEDKQKRQEKLWSSKDTAIAHISRGLFEISTTIDFLSLLISKQSSMAMTGVPPHYQSLNISAGSVEPRVVQVLKPQQSSLRQQTEVSNGQKIAGLEKAYDKLFDASKRLQQVCKREVLFWGDAASIKANGWKISRHPASREKAFGVHFGLTDSNNGFALFREDTNGRLDLEKPKVKHPKQVSITIERHGEVTYVAPLNERQKETLDASWMVKAARDQLVEANLFHQMAREARSVADASISVRGNSVTLHIDQSLSIKLSQDSSTNEATTCSNDADAAMVAYVRLCLKSLLLAPKTSRTARPLSAKVTARTEKSILRTMTANLRHQTAMSSLLRALKSHIVLPLVEAGLESSVVVKESSISFEVGSRPLSLLSDGQQSNTVSLQLTAERTLDTTIMSSLAPPIYGIKYEMSTLTTGDGNITGRSTADLDALLEPLQRAAILSLLEVLQQANSSEKGWNVISARKGEMSYIDTPGGRAVATMRIQLVSKELIAKFHFPKTSATLMAAWSTSGLKIAADSVDLKSTVGNLEKASLLNLATKAADFAQSEV